MSSAEFLARMPLFAELSSTDLGTLAASFWRRNCAKGEIIFHVGEPGTACYIIETGRVKISVTSQDRKQITLALLGPADLFGELALVDGARRSTDAVALEQCQLLELRRDQFIDFLHAHQAATFKVLTAVTRRLRRTGELLEDAVFLQVPSRLAKLLLELAESDGEQTPSGILIGPNLTQSELAALVGATRESINKWLGFYQQRGFVQFDGGRIVVCRPEELRRQVY